MNFWGLVTAGFVEERLLQCDLWMIRDDFPLANIWMPPVCEIEWMITYVMVTGGIVKRFLWYVNFSQV